MTTFDGPFTIKGYYYAFGTGWKPPNCHLGRRKETHVSAIEDEDNYLFDPDSLMNLDLRVCGSICNSLEIFKYNYRLRTFCNQLEVGRRNASQSLLIWLPRAPWQSYEMQFCRFELKAWRHILVSFFGSVIMDMANLYAAINGPSEVIPTSLRDSDSESNLMKAQKDQKQITILYCLEWRIISQRNVTLNMTRAQTRRLVALGVAQCETRRGRPKHVNNDNIEMSKD
ncbi:hypothetical protein BDBG_00669 [Blastomyces gilchristii SLH14081]|uniref:Uncharacterized protein n=1 Tax=Blastomyces gilchristii (strain SLH14081) TaxID=559298 RepID=A0A179U9Q1_BLAGS|nr:uncharacterized protein BDBG_00669 [Blastomyces gilchristii SLH14081]OAT04039.1 hypothetical protein BDBG_00669 [Blastomyces gilchristii SLH14081]